MSSRLSAQARDRLATLHIEQAGLRALNEMVRTLDPGLKLSRWALAGRVAAHIDRFEATAWPRISRGAREPRGPAEAAMCAMLRAGLPRSQKRICDLIA
jgi:hypothetical protein